MRRFLEDDLPDRGPDEARFHLIPFPLERSVSYGGGTANGPDAILEASTQLEAFDGEGIPGEAGIYCHPPVDCSGEDVDSMLGEAGRRVAACVSQGKVPITLGGEHTVTVGPVRALAKRGHRFGVVQFDAHADLRDTYQGSPLSHACVMRRVADIDIPFFQIGVRSLSAPESVFRKECAIPFLDADRLMTSGYPEVLLPDDFPEQVYITFDVDALDPSLMPSTGTPEPGGLFWYEAVEGIRRVLSGRHLLAADVVELAPRPEWPAADFTAAKLVYTLMGFSG
jgi:agmatinase